MNVPTNIILPCLLILSCLEVDMLSVDKTGVNLETGVFVTVAADVNRTQRRLGVIMTSILGGLLHH